MRWGLVLLAAVTLLAAGLRWFRIDAQSLWYDEGISAHQVLRTYPEIARAAALDTHPPLYYWTLKAWADTFGASELGLRSLSAVWGVVVVVVTFLLGRRAFGTLAGTLAALLLAVSPLAVYYSQEVRMYSQVTALGLIAVYAYMRTWSNPRWYAAYVVAAIATLYSQYLGAALLIALNIHALVWHRTRTWFIANVLVALAFVPWLPTFIAQQTHALNVSPRTPGGLLQSTLEAYGGGIAHDAMLGVGGVLLVLLALGSLIALVAPRNGRRQPEALALALLLWLLPLGLVLGLGLRNGLFEVRYLVLSLPGLCLLAGAGSLAIARQPLLGVAVAGVALGPMLAGLEAQYFDPTLARDDYRGLVQTIEREAQPKDVVVLSAPNQIEIFDYYYHGPAPTVPLPAQRPIDPDDTRRRLDELRAQYDRVWLVNWAMNEADPPGVIATWLAENGFQATHGWYGSVQLALVGLGASNASTQQVETPLDNGVVLEGYRLGDRSLQPGGTLALTLVWRAQSGPTPDRWKVFTHLLDANSNVVAQRDAEPADNLRPTTTWQPGERIQDNYGIVVPPDLPAGMYTIEVGMYDGEHRATFAGRGDALVLATLPLSR